MKKNFLGITMLLCMMAVAHINIRLENQNDLSSSFMLSNVEALATQESMTEEELAKLGCKVTTKK